MVFLILCHRLLFLPSCAVTPAPDGTTVFTSTRSVTALAAGPDGSLWVGTTGGLLRRDPTGHWRKLTRRDGLPAHEVRAIEADGDAVTVLLAGCRAVRQGGTWQSEALPETPAGPAGTARQTCATRWRGVRITATVTGLRIGEGTSRREVPLPTGAGTHISALLAHGEELWAGLFGDGLWAFDGKSWRALDLKLPAEAREVTALAEAGNRLWLGTRRAGLWGYDGAQWTQTLQPGEPYEHNCQALAEYGGVLYASTLEDGLAAWTPGGWQHLGTPPLSSDAPRQMVEYGRALYVRHGNGKVDRFDGRTWERDVFRSLPRRQASALASDGARLYVAQWGGWSEWDGHTWAHHLQHPELQGLSLTALLPEGDTLWVGTQGRGVAQLSRARGTVTWHDEREGLPDDWVKGILRAGKTLYASTFVGGIAWREGARWAGALPGEEITALAPDGAGGAFLATRRAVWRRTPDGKLERVTAGGLLENAEAQALCPVPGGLWVGARTGVYFVRW